MRGKLLLALCCCVTALIPGCGSGLFSSHGQPLEHGRATFTVKWPERSRLIPVASNSIVVTVSNVMRVVSRQVVARPASGGTSSVTFPSLPVGMLGVTASAAPNTDGSGTVQAAASAPLAIQPGATTAITLTMDSTVDHLQLTTPTQTLKVGETETLTAAAYNTEGSIVLTSPSTLKWSSSGGAVTVVNGVVTAQSAGTATVSVVEQESGKAVAVNLTVSEASGAIPQQSVAYQIDPAHTGHAVFGRSLTFPSSPTWSVDLGGALSYALIAGGRVYVMGPPTGNLHCLDLATGQALWVTTAGGFRAQAYDQSKVFMLSLGGTLLAIDAVTGQEGWSVQLPGQYSFDATPTAVNGTVYAGGAGSGGTVYAVDASNGAIRWTTSVINGMQSAPAVTSDGLFVAYPCHSYKLSLATGSSLWHYDSGCSGGGGRTEAVANGRVYDRENGGLIFDAATGAQVGSFASDRIPAFTTTIGCFLSGGTLRAKDLSTDTVLWSFDGDGQLNSAPLIIDQTVIIGSATGTIYALNATTGQQIWSGSAGAGLPKPDEQNVSVPLTGFAAGEGYLIVTAGTRLTAWHIAGP